MVQSRFLSSVVIVSTLLALTLIATPGIAKISLGVDAAGRFQAIESDNPAGQSNDEEAGFGSERANIHIYGDVAQGVDVYTEILVNPSATDAVFRDLDGDGTPEEATTIEDAGDVRFKQGYVTFTGLLPYIDVKAGAMELDFGNPHLYRSDNGQVLENPLVGNYLVDPVATQSGVEISGESRRVAWKLAVTNGLGDLQGTILGGEQFTAQDREFAFSGKIWGDLTPMFSAAFSFYSVDQTDAIANQINAQTPLPVPPNPSPIPATAIGSAELASNLFGVQDPIYQGLTSSAAPQLGATPVGGADVTAYQLDLEYTTLMGTEFKGHYGIFEEDATPSDLGLSGAVPTQQEWDYYGLEAVHNLTPQTYLVARYSAAENSKGADPGPPLGTGQAIDQEYEKIQIGAGHDLNQNTRLKIEWVSQENDSSNMPGPAGPSQAELSGFMAEVGVSF